MTRFLNDVPVWLYPLVILTPSIPAVVWYVVVWVGRGGVPTVVRVAAWAGWPLIGWGLTQYAFAKLPPVESNPPLFSEWGSYLWMGLVLMLLAVPLGLADLVMFVNGRFAGGASGAAKAAEDWAWRTTDPLVLAAQQVLYVTGAGGRTVSLPLVIPQSKMGPFFQGLGMVRSRLAGRG